MPGQLSFFNGLFYPLFGFYPLFLLACLRGLSITSSSLSFSSIVTRTVHGALQSEWGLSMVSTTGAISLQSVEAIASRTRQITYYNEA